VAVEPRARLFVAEGLSEAFGAERMASAKAVVRELRGTKDEHELALLRAANELTQRAIAAAAERLRPGLTDAAIGRMMTHAQERLGLTDTWVLPLLNADAALPHGSATERVLAPGDLVLVDTGGALHGYQSDNTRTWVFGAPPGAEVERAWRAVRDAQQRAFEALRPGAPCAGADRAARTSIEAAGFGAGYAAFTHRLGHGIGLEGHEEPYLDGGNELALGAGMAFSDEPGIYLPGRFGVRLEDIVCITAQGADHFGSWQRSPASPA
jgi:Xaa-Pro dipeptidase